MQKRVPISQLQTGMFVEGVTRQTGNVKIKNKGWVKTQAAIDKLKKVGIQEVQIDPSKTLSNEPKSPSKPAVPPAEQVMTPAKPPAETHRDPWHASTSFESELGKAHKLYEEAKALQSKAFSDIKSGRKIDIAPFREVADGFITSVFNNQDALTCLTRIRDKDSYLLEHSINVSILISIFAKHMFFDRDTIHQLATGALLHDIGKIKIADEILFKPGKLSDDEFDQMKNHARYSREILEEAGLSGIPVDVASFHHERLDGKGYPFGLSEPFISTYVRMASIVDVYDALTAERVYKEGMTPLQAFKLLNAGCPDSFDPDMVHKFVQSIGVYPVGTLVKLVSQRVGIVSRANPENPLRPCVKTFYNAKFGRYTEVKEVDLSNKREPDELQAAIKPEQFNIDLMRFFKQSIMP